jgi:hypothetical protein
LAASRTAIPETFLIVSRRLLEALCCEPSGCPCAHTGFAGQRDGYRGSGARGVWPPHSPPRSLHVRCDRATSRSLASDGGSASLSACRTRVRKSSPTGGAHGSRRSHFAK